MNKGFKRFLITLLLVVAGPAAAESDQHYMSTAQAYLKEGDVKAAVIQLKNLLRQSPGNAEARLLIGEVYLKLNNGASARKELEKARSLHLSKEKWIVPLGRAYLLTGQFKDLLDEIQVEAQLPEKTRAEVLALRGSAHLALQDPEKAQTDFDAALKLDETASDAWLGKARLALQQRQFDQAADYARKVLATDKKNENAWVMLGETERLAGKQQSAIDGFSQAITLRPDNVQARLGRATAYIASGKLQDAEKDVAYVRKTAGDMPFALYLHAVIAFQDKDIDEAEDALFKVLGQMPDHLPSLLLMGTIAYSKGKLESAEDNLSRYVKVYPKHLPAVKLLGATRMKSKRPDEAVILLESVRGDAEDDPQFLALLGSAYMQSKQFDKGTVLLSRAADLAPDIAAIHAQLALGHFATGQMDQAVGDLQQAVDLGQGLIQADVMLVLALIQQKKYDQAIEAADRMGEKMPDNPMPDNLLAAAYMAKGDKDRARAYWEHALKIKPDYATAAINLARLEVASGNFEAAARQYEKVLNQQPAHLNALIGMAQIAEQKKDHDKMLEWLELAREKNPTAVQPALMLTKYYIVKNKPLKALEVARAGQDANPDNDVALRNLGNAQMAAGENASAVLIFRRLVGKMSDNPEARFLLGQALYRNGDVQAATDEWDEALRLSPDHLRAAAAKAEAALKQKKYGQALKYAQNLQKKHPTLPVGFQLAGDSEYGQKHWAQAQAEYEKGYALSPSAPLARRLYQVDRKQGNDASAFERLEGWLKQTPDDANSWLMLAMGYQETGNMAKAVTGYEKAYALAPENYVVLNNLAWLYQEKGDPRSVKLAEKILLIKDENPEVIDTAGWILLNNGQENRGLVLLQQAAVLAPHIALIRIHLAQAYLKTGRQEDARKELKRLLKDKKDFPERKQAQALLDSI